MLVGPVVRLEHAQDGLRQVLPQRAGPPAALHLRRRRQPQQRYNDFDIIFCSSSSPRQRFCCWATSCICIALLGGGAGWRALGGVVTKFKLLKIENAISVFIRPDAPSATFVGKSPVMLPYIFYQTPRASYANTTHIGDNFGTPAGGSCSEGTALGDGGCTWKREAPVRIMYYDDLIAHGWNASLPRDTPVDQSGRWAPSCFVQPAPHPPLPLAPRKPPSVLLLTPSTRRFSISRSLAAVSTTLPRWMPRGRASTPTSPRAAAGADPSTHPAYLQRKRSQARVHMWLGIRFGSVHELPST